MTARDSVRARSGRRPAAGGSPALSGGFGPGGPPSLDPEICYRALKARDPRFDGWFFTGVTSTGIYCRPSCPSILPRQDHLCYYPTSAAAQRAGFRACKRCRPDASPGSPEWNRRGDVVGRAMRSINDGVVDREGVSGLAEHLGYSARQLQRLMIDEVGAGPLELARAQRAETARILLETTGLRVGEVAFAAGFGSIRQFNDTVRAIFGETPMAMRERARRHRPASRSGGPVPATAGRDRPPRRAQPAPSGATGFARGGLPRAGLGLDPLAVPLALPGETPVRLPRRPGSARARGGRWGVVQAGDDPFPRCGRGDGDRRRRGRVAVPPPARRPPRPDDGGPSCPPAVRPRCRSAGGHRSARARPFAARRGGSAARSADPRSRRWRRARRAGRPRAAGERRRCPNAGRAARPSARQAAQCPGRIRPKGVPSTSCDRRSVTR